MSQNTQFLSIVARLMASENVAIKHDPNATTASFDLVARRLTLPVYKSMSDDLYEMLLAHEVGHALWTPLAGWHKSLSERGRSFKSFLNVVEDVRIERKIKQKFPGVTKSFHSAYKELLEMDFFGLTAHNVDVKELPFIDRLNIAMKVGPLMGVPFSVAEEDLVEQAQALETFEEVEEFAGRLYDMEVAARQSRSHKGLVRGFKDAFEGMALDGESDATDDQVDFDEDYVPEDQNINLDELEETEEGTEDDENRPTRGGGDNDYRKKINEAVSDAEPVSFTDTQFHEREDQLAAGSTNYWGGKPASYIFNIRDIDLSKFVAPASKVVENAVTYNSGWQSAANHQLDLVEFLKSEEKAINHLVNDFTMKQNAHRYAHASQGKSGKLDMKNLHNYKLVDDIFLRATKVPKGKNHGMVLFFDQSGSMQGIYKQTIQQMIIMIEFCRRLSIPVEVYGFCDAACSRQAYFEFNYANRSGMWLSSDSETDVVLSNQNHLKQYISTGMSAGEYKKALLALWMICNDHTVPNETLWATPLNTALVLSRQIVNNFKKATKVDVANVIFLTDGDASDYIAGKVGTNGDQVRFVCDGYMSAKPRSYGNYQGQTAVLADLMKRVTGANYIGVFLTSQTKTLKDELDAHIHDWIQTNKPLLGDPKNDNVVMTQNYGFNSYFITRRLSRLQSAVDLSSVNEKTTVNKLSQVFSQQSTTLAQSRTFLSLFASEISSAKNL